MIVVITLVTIRVGDQSVVTGGAYELYAIFTNAAGLYPKASIEVAGVNVGIVRKITLTADGKAQVLMGVQKHVKIPENSQAFMRSRGFLGESYVEIIPGDTALPPLKSGAYIVSTASGGDISDMVDQFNSIAEDIKVISHTMRKWVDEKEGGAIARTVHNLDDFVKILRNLTVQNEKNLDQIMHNMAALTGDLRGILHTSRYDAEAAIERISSITQKIDEGRGTIGKLVNDPETANKLNDSLDSLSEALGGYKKMELGLGFHTEYLGETSDFKNYVEVQLKPTPDEALILGVVSDPSPDTTRERKISDVTVGGSTTRVTTENEVLKRDQVLFSAQLAKRFYDLTVRGGIIESKGGLGADYQAGPIGLHFDAFDFETRFNEKPHLKAYGTLNLTKNIYVMGGLDDPLNPAQKTDYFGGGGFRFVDDDIKSLLGLASLKP